MNDYRIDPQEILALALEVDPEAVTVDDVSVLSDGQIRVLAAVDGEEGGQA